MRAFLIAAILTGVLLASAGCGELRFAPGESQKQNAWLHSRVARLAAEEARAEDCSGELRGLTELSARQSDAFVAYFGMPAEPEEVRCAADALGGVAGSMAEAAIREGSERVDLWRLADGLMELGLGIAGVFGGVYGVKAARFLREAREKSNALAEIIRGNEVFKQKRPELAEAFKEAHVRQSSQTRKIVAEAKS